jgi:hypothetical protein
MKHEIHLYYTSKLILCLTENTQLFSYKELLQMVFMSIILLYCENNIA